MQVTKFFRNFAIKLNKMGQKEEKEKIKTARETLERYFYDLSKTFWYRPIRNVLAVFYKR